MLVIFYFCSLVFGMVGAQKPPIVNTLSGKIQGFNALSSNGASFCAFLNIPFAVPPVGDLRFTYPQPFGKWNGTRIGNKSGNACPQMSFLNTSEFKGEDDCLNLNVYVSQCKTNFANQNLPVMVYLYGGGYSYGSNSYAEYGPEKYMDFPVILVIPNYRVGAFGFLSTNDSNAYGNYGLMDNIEALKWVQKNIKFFGGDPKRVTIFGNSAGAVSVVHLILSPLSKGLFSRAIPESGSPISGWSVSRTLLANTQSLAKKVNCLYENNADLVKCLRSKTAREIAFASRESQLTKFIPIPFVPVIEAPGGPGFLTQEPVDIIRERKIGNAVPMLIGHTSLEGYAYFKDFEPTFPYNGNGRDFFRKRFVPDILPLISGIQPSMKNVTKAIKNYYKLDDLDLNNRTIFVKTYSQIIGDIIFSASSSATADLLSQAGLQVYVFLYSYISDKCFAYFFHAPCGLYCSHADELFIQFIYFGFSNATNSDKQMTKTLNSLWVDFASHKDLYLSPNVPWPAYNTSKPKHAVLNLPPTVGSGPTSNATEFWMETIPKLVQKYI